MRVPIDASVLLRVLLPSANPARAVDVILAAAAAGAFTLLLPPELRAEVIEKAEARPALASQIAPGRARAFVALLAEIGLPLAPYSGPYPTLGRDADDDHLLAYALRDRADFLVTGDQDLLDLAPGFAPRRIVDPGAFVREQRAQGLIVH